MPMSTVWPASDPSTRKPSGLPQRASPLLQLPSNYAIKCWKSKIMRCCHFPCRKGSNFLLYRLKIKGIVL